MRELDDEFRLQEHFTLKDSIVILCEIYYISVKLLIEQTDWFGSKVLVTYYIIVLFLQKKETKRNSDNWYSLHFFVGYVQMFDVSNVLCRQSMLLFAT